MILTLLAIACLVLLGVVLALAQYAAKQIERYNAAQADCESLSKALVREVHRADDAESRTTTAVGGWIDALTCWHRAEVAHTTAIELLHAELVRVEAYAPFTVVHKGAKARVV